MFNMITNLVGTGMNKSANGKTADEATAPALDTLDIAGYNYAAGREISRSELISATGRIHICIAPEVETAGQALPAQAQKECLL